MVFNLSDKITISEENYFNFSNLNNKLKFAQIDDLIIEKTYRNTPDIIVKLFIIGLEIGMLNLVKILITFSTKESVVMYDKIGFEKLQQEPIAKINTYVRVGPNESKELHQKDLYPMIYNLAQSVVKVDKSSLSYEQYGIAMNTDILEYYVKRNLFSPLFLSWKHRDFNLKANDINKIIESSGALKC
jgi:hypothetical protein